MGRDLLWNCRILFYVITEMGRNLIGIAKKLGRDLLLNCKILSSNIIAILPAPIIAYRLSQIDLGSSGSPWATGWADLCSIWGLTAQFFLFFWYSFLGRQCYNMAAILTVEYRDGSSYWTLTPAKDTWTCLTAGLSAHLAVAAYPQRWPAYDLAGSLQ